MRVPTEVTEEIKLLLSKISSKAEPVFVICSPSPNAPRNECFPLVEAKIEKEGGERVLGWQIWQGQLLVEAEFHAVWKTPAGEFLDITPKPFPVEQIFFVADPKTKYEGKQINNIRINITGNPLVDEFISVHDAVFRIENKGKRALQYQLSLSGKEADAHNKLNAAKPMLEMMALQGNTRNSSCLCGSREKYKACHGKIIRKLLNDF
ncbi:MAG: SEC-C domain-containing protein [Methylobacter sp.]|nr:SEC-C domain-containing protein [Methylobacter sp.]